MITRANEFAFVLMGLVGFGVLRVAAAELARGCDFHEAKVVDINRDGRLDMVNKPFVWDAPQIDIWLNLRPQP